MKTHAGAGKIQLVKTTMTVRAMCVLAALLIAGVTLGLGATTVPAQSQTPDVVEPTSTPQPQPADSTSMELASQTAWVTPNGGFDLTAQLRTDRPLNSLNLAVTVFAPVRSRFAYTQSLANQISTPAVILQRLPLEETVSPEGVISVSLPVTDSSKRSTYLPNSGVYPVRVELRESQSNETISHFVTHLLKVAGSFTPLKMNVATVLPIQAADAADPTEPRNLPSNGSEFADFAGILNDYPDAEVTTVVSPESAERLFDHEDPVAQQSLDALASSVANRELLATTWERIPASLYGGPISERDAQFDRGLSVIQERVSTPDTKTWAALDPLSPTALQTLNARGVERLVVRESNLANLNRSTTLSQPFAVRFAGATIPAVQADSALSAHFDGEGSSVLRAHQLLADLAVLYNDYPGQSRGVAVMAPSDWLVDPAFLRTYLKGLSEAPVLSAGSTSDLFAVKPYLEGGSVLNRPLGNLSTDENPVLSTARLAEQRRKLSGLSSMVSAGNETFDQLNERLLASQSLDLSSENRFRALSAFDVAFQSQIDAIRLPSERSIRLTARQGEIPVSIQNDTGYPVEVLVKLTGDQLVFIGGSERTIAVERQQFTDRFGIEARTSGAFPVQVEVTSPDGTIEIARSRLTVRSTATSGVGLALTIGSLGFLVLWWFHSIWKTRRQAKASRFSESMHP